MVDGRAGDVGIRNEFYLHSIDPVRIKQRSVLKVVRQIIQLEDAVMHELGKTRIISPLSIWKRASINGQHGLRDSRGKHVPGGL